MAKLTVRASNGVRFSLLPKYMNQREGKHLLRLNGGYVLLRKDLKEALPENGKVYYGFLESYEANGRGVLSLGKFLQQGTTQRHKKYLQIGCMRFVGNERTKLIRWAKAAK